MPYYYKVTTTFTPTRVTAIEIQRVAYDPWEYYFDIFNIARQDVMEDHLWDMFFGEEHEPARRQGEMALAVMLRSDAYFKSGKVAVGGCPYTVTDTVEDAVDAFLDAWKDVGLCIN